MRSRLTLIFLSFFFMLQDTSGARDARDDSEFLVVSSDTFWSCSSSGGRDKSRRAACFVVWKLYAYTAATDCGSCMMRCRVHVKSLFLF